MPYTPYRRMTSSQAAVALEEFPTERPAAFERLRIELTTHGLNPDLHHHPVLIGNGHQVYVPTLPLGGVLRLKAGERSLHATELEEYADGVIADLRTGPPVPLTPQDSPVVVVSEPRLFDVGVHPVIAERSSHLVGHMADELAGLDGVLSVLRSAPDARQVDASAWDAGVLEQWLLTWMKANGPFIR